MESLNIDSIHHAFVRVIYLENQYLRARPPLATLSYRGCKNRTGPPMTMVLPSENL